FTNYFNSKKWQFLAIIVGAVLIYRLFFRHSLVLSEFPALDQLPIIAKNSASERTGTPRDWALVSLEPAASPATTKLVFLETEPLALPPFFTIKASASLRERLSRVPVTTMVLPASLSVLGSPFQRILTPRSASRWTRSEVPSLA